MDDVYQYTAEAVKANKNSNTHNVQTDQEEEEDPLVNAFNNFGFGRRWSNLVDSVKKQSEEVINVTRNDLQEFAQVLRDDTTQTVEKLSKTVAATTPTSPTNTKDIKGKGKATAVSQQEESEANTTTSSVWNYISQISSQLPSAMHLPGNIDLGRLREEMDQGTRFAEQYMQKFGTEVMQTLNKTITVLDPEDDDSSTTKGKQHDSIDQSASSARVFASRKDQLLAEMRSNKDTFLNDIKDSKDMEGFDAEERTEEIAKLLEEYPDLRQMMDKLVPVQVNYVLFWKRYFYHAWKIEEEDKKRQLITKAAQEEDDFKWDSEDEDEEQSPKDTSDNVDKQPKSSSNNDSKAAGGADKRQDNPVDQKDDDSDSDWE
ncbi:hypothetical protein LRAMOSA10695 [Lichtheimia ramosa]|uniref:BSD domain-containing protein n=1 Tax=Lichtheimia ramosa TaxID=688394 RepID=A0A077WPI9_9FUNG|nr:hypothetical protein LRAMOSA10695 [Lichtheimia ramosa]